MWDYVLKIAENDRELLVYQVISFNVQTRHIRFTGQIPSLIENIQKFYGTVVDFSAISVPEEVTISPILWSPAKRWSTGALQHGVLCWISTTIRLSVVVNGGSESYGACQGYPYFPYIFLFDGEPVGALRVSQPSNSRCLSQPWNGKFSAQWSHISQSISASCEKMADL